MRLQDTADSKTRNPAVSAARRILLACLAVGLLGTTGCRRVAVETDPGQAYSIEVDNPLAVEMLVSYVDERGSHELGVVPARSREYFVIAGPSSTAVTITAAGGGRSARPRPVTLLAGQTVPVRLSY